VGEALGKPARLLPLPESVLRVGAAALGRRDMAQRLLGSLQVDIGKAHQLLDWEPPISVNAELKKTADAFLGKAV